jgi:uridine kinase
VSVEVYVEIGDEPEDIVVGVTGMKGSGCHALTKDLEEALGVVTESRNTPEYEEKEARRGDERRAVTGR